MEWTAQATGLPESTLALIIGPAGAVVVLAIVAWLLWGELKKNRAMYHDAMVRVTTALEANTTALAIDKRLEKLENKP